MVLAAGATLGWIFQGLNWAQPGNASAFVYPFWSDGVRGLPVDVLNDPIAFGFRTSESPYC